MDMSRNVGCCQQSEEIVAERYTPPARFAVKVFVAAAQRREIIADYTIAFVGEIVNKHGG